MEEYTEFLAILKYFYILNIKYFLQDRVSRVLFPSTFILLNIIYWLVFSDILDSLHPNSDLVNYT